MEDLNDVINALQAFQTKSLKSRVAGLETTFSNTDAASAIRLLIDSSIDSELLEKAFQIKALAGQVNVVIHTIGILLSLPDILVDGEQVLSLSLGAGNTGRDFDLETNLRVAEYKFIQWKGGSETIRQNQLFKDFFYLAEYKTTKQKYLYVLGLDKPMKFLGGGRSINSVCSRNSKLKSDFYEAHGEKYERVRQYFAEKAGQVKVVDLREASPMFSVY